jgi:parallel beta-helix repeat protein
MALQSKMVITESTTFAPGVHYLPDGISVEGSDIIVNGNGSHLIGANQLGQGITIRGGKNVTIKNFFIHGYYHGISVSETSRLTITDCIITNSGEIKANTIFLDIWIPAEQAYGAAIFLVGVSDATIERNNLSHQMNGLLSYKCCRLNVKDNIANYNSGWGFHLNQTTQSSFEDNYADYCCRYEPRGVAHGHLGADSAGFLIVNRSSYNTFIHNFARLGGDGFFLAGLNPAFEHVGCEHNVFRSNDSSYSPNNAFEAVFSEGNIFESNRANYSNYGFWLGFSSAGSLINNQIIGNRQAGIATENGIDFIIERNTFERNHHGILLWSKHIPEFDQALPDNKSSINWKIERNTFIRNYKGIRIAADQDHGVRPLPTDGKLGYPAPHPSKHVIKNNRFEANTHVIETVDTVDTIIDSNELIDNTYE